MVVGRDSEEGVILAGVNLRGVEKDVRLENNARVYQIVKHLIWDQQDPNKAKVTLFTTYYIPIAGEIYIYKGNNI